MFYRPTDSKLHLLCDVSLCWERTPVTKTVNTTRQATGNKKVKQLKAENQRMKCLMLQTLINVTLLQNDIEYKCLCETQQEMKSSDVILLSQQVAHTQRVLPGWIWSQSVGAAGHVVLSLRNTGDSQWDQTTAQRFTLSKDKTMETCMQVYQTVIILETIFPENSNVRCDLCPFVLNLPTCTVKTADGRSSVHDLNRLKLFSRILKMYLSDAAEKLSSPFIITCYLSELWTHRAAPVWLGGHLSVRVDAIKLGQSLLFDLLQVLLQRQISVCEEPEEHLFYTCLKSSVVFQIFFPGSVLLSVPPTWRCWGGSAWRGTAWAAPRWGRGWLKVPLLTPQSRCGLDTACSGGAGRTRARCLTGKIHTLKCNYVRFCTCWHDKSSTISTGSF